MVESPLPPGDGLADVSLYRSRRRRRSRRLGKVEVAGSQGPVYFTVGCPIKYIAYLT